MSYDWTAAALESRRMADETQVSRLATRERLLDLVPERDRGVARILLESLESLASSEQNFRRDEVRCALYAKEDAARAALVAQQDGGGR